MGPRVQVEPREFQEIADREKGLVIKKKALLQPFMYVIRSGDYYYYTVCRKELPLPFECTVTEAKNVLL